MPLPPQIVQFEIKPNHLVCGGADSYRSGHVTTISQPLPQPIVVTASWIVIPTNASISFEYNGVPAPAGNYASTMTDQKLPISFVPSADCGAHRITLIAKSPGGSVKVDRDVTMLPAV